MAKYTRVEDDAKPKNGGKLTKKKEKEKINVSVIESCE